MRNLKEFKVKSSRRDPDYAVHELDGKIIRRIDIQQIEAIKALNQDKKFFPDVLEPIVGNLEHYEVEKLPFIVFPYELPFQLYKTYALFYLRLLNKLLKEDASLKDATPFNINYQGNGILLHFDLGSIEPYDATTGWKGYRQFLAEFYFPLLYLTENKGIYSSDLIKLQFDKQWIHHYKFKWRNYMRPAFNIHYVFYKNSRIKKLNDKRETKTVRISKNQVASNIALLEAEISKWELPKVKTKWDNYYAQTVLQDGYVQKKEELVSRYLKDLSSNADVKFAIDWGANDGKFSELLSDIYKDATVLSIESDYNAINQLFIKYRKKRIIPIYTDILNLTPDLGFDGERVSLKDRLAKVNGLQLCLGLIHHLIHQENISFEVLIDFFASCALPESYLLIEFLHAEDPRHQLIKNPNYPYELSRDYFKESLTKHYEILRCEEVIKTREIFLCRKIRREVI